MFKQAQSIIEERGPIVTLENGDWKPNPFIEIEAEERGPIVTLENGDWKPNPFIEIEAEQRRLLLALLRAAPQHQGADCRLYTGSAGSVAITPTGLTLHASLYPCGAGR
jgi:hypothetical protein